MLVGATFIPSLQDETTDDIAVFYNGLMLQKRAEQALLQTEKLTAVGRLASSISQEINNPLEAVTNLLYIVKGSQNLNQTDRDYREAAERELGRVSQITTQTLRFHRQSSAAAEVEPESYSKKYCRSTEPGWRVPQWLCEGISERTFPSCASKATSDRC